MGGTRFMVQWEEHPSHLATRLGQLLEHQTLVDVTLMCNTHTLRVHRAVLAACSPYFEVRGLSAMTKEALGLTSTPAPKATTVNVSKNVRFHHNVTPGSAVTVEPSRTCSLDSSVVKKQEPSTVKSEVIDRVPVVTPNGGVKSSSVVLPTQVADKALEQQVVPEKTVEGTKEDISSQVFYVEDGPCKRGRPLKRQMNLVFKEKVFTDADMALEKEAEASRKAVEMLQQEMSTGDEAPATIVAPANEPVQQKIIPVKPMTKLQPSQQINNLMTNPTRILPKEPIATSKVAAQKANIVSQVTAASTPTPEASSQNIIYQVAGNTLPAIDSNSNETNIVYQLQDGVISGQDASGANIVYQVADNAVLAGQDANSQNIIYQVADNSGSTAEGNNTNIIYQVAEGGNSGSVLEALKEAGLSSDVPILLESSDGHYVSVNEEVLMNIMNGGMVQVSDGSIVGGEGVQFIVQEVQEVNEGQVESAGTSAEQTVAETNVASTPVTAAAPATTTEATVATESTSSVAAPFQEMQVIQANDVAEPKPASASANLAKHSTYKPAKGQQSKLNVAKTVVPVEIKETARLLSDAKKVMESPYTAALKSEVKKGPAKEETSTPMEIDEPLPEPESVSEAVPKAPTHSDEVITGDTYGEEAMEGFAVIETKDTQQEASDQPESHTSDFEFPAKSKKKSPLKTEPAKEIKAEDSPANGSMSVEQALQAMMGEGSDTEMEVCANTDADGTTKVKTVISHHDTKGRSTPNEGSIDEETEDLRLVLSPEDESIKVEDESQSAEGSINDSFTLALSSPDSTGNEKIHLDAESNEGSQSELKPRETDKESSEVKESVRENEAEFLEFNAETVNNNESLTKDTFKINSAVTTSSSEGSVLVSADASTDSNSVDLKVVESAEESTVAEGERDIHLESGSGPLSPQTTESENVVNDKQDENLKIAEPGVGIEDEGTLPELMSSNANSELNEEGSEKSCSQPESISEHLDSANTESKSEVGISLPILDSDASIEEGTDEKALDDTGFEMTDTSTNENIPKIAIDNTSFSLSPVESKGTDNTVPHSGPSDSRKSPLMQVETSEPVTAVGDSLSNASSSGSKETEFMTQLTTVTDDTQIAEVEETKLDAEGTVRVVNTTENEDDPEMLPDSVIADENGVEGQGAVTSPNKDIPYAVGLLPLNIALEKFQAMPEYHPRKTRSASSGKESASDVPASRLKRKCSSTAENSEKKLKSDDGEGCFENESIAAAMEESEEDSDKHLPLESCANEDGSSKPVESPTGEEHMETGDVENKVEPLPSMMELVSDSSEAV
ncbi:hypothetical protein C0J52_03360 [Blattella germanica]|nr:hypothetical protein C0J52_03360 [Blattella germanica]